MTGPDSTPETQPGDQTSPGAEPAPEQRPGSRWWTACAVLVASIIGGVFCLAIASPLLMFVFFSSPYGQAFVVRQEATANAVRHPDTWATSAAQATAVARAAGGKYIVREPFDTDPEWWCGRNDALSTNRRQVVDGSYHWELEATESTFAYVLPGRHVSSNFHLTVEADQVGGPDSSGYGLLFRVVDSGHFLYFGINESAGEFAFLKYYDGEWTPLIEPTYSPAIRQDGPNHLVVEADGLRYTLSINDRCVGEAEDDKLVAGDVGLMVDLSTTNVTNVFEFDNFELRLP